MSQMMTGARGRVRIDGKIVGFMSGINITSEYTLTRIDAMGSLESADIAETGHTASFSINVFKALRTDAGVTQPSARGDSATNTPSTIGFDTASVQAGVVPMRDQAFFDVEVEDDQTGDVIVYLQKCKYAGGSGQVDARGVWTGAWNFEALRCIKL